MERSRPRAVAEKFCFGVADEEGSWEPGRRDAAFVAVTTAVDGLPPDDDVDVMADVPRALPLMERPPAAKPVRVPLNLGDNDPDIIVDVAVVADKEGGDGGRG